MNRKLKKAPSASLFFVLLTRNMLEITHVLLYFPKKSCMKTVGEINLNIKPLKYTPVFCFLCTTKLRAEYYQAHV